MEIAVTYVDGVMTYNGYTSVYEALWNSEEEFRQLSFAERICVTSEVLNDIEHPQHDPETLTYTIKRTGSTTYFKVLNANGETVMSYTGSTNPPWMKNDFDLEGLHNFLVSTNSIHPDDIIIWVDG